MELNKEELIALAASVESRITRMTLYSSQLRPHEETRHDLEVLQGLLSKILVEVALYKEDEGDRT